MTMTFKDRLRQTGDRMTMHVCTIPSATVTQALAAAGADAVIVDLEHGATGYTEAQAMIAATAGTRCAPTVRVARLEDADVKRALDIGAEGIVFPLVGTAEQAEWAVRSLRYPPEGTRSFGPFVAHSRYGQDMMSYARTFADRALTIILAETVEAVENIEKIVKVPGIDLIIPAQFDLTTSMGIPGQFDHPDYVAALTRIEDAVRAAGIPLGGVALDAGQAQAAFGRGYRVIAGFDLLWLKARAAQAQEWCGQGPCGRASAG